MAMIRVGVTDMPDVADHRQWLKRTMHTSLKRFSKWRRAIKIALVIGGALLAAAAGASTDLVEESRKWVLHYIQIFGALLVFIGGVVLEYFDEGAADAIRRADELADIAEQQETGIISLATDFRWFTTLSSVAAALRDIVEGVIEHGAGSEEEQRKRFGAMLDVVVAEKVVLFGMDSDRWNFAVYLLNPSANILECRACRRPIRAEEEAPHRSWRLGEGHVGIAFQTQREIVASDTSEPEARSLFDAPDPSRREDDRARYRSIASIPVRVAGGAPFGVLVATSDVVGRFRIRQREDDASDPVEPLRILAGALAMMIKIADLRRRESEEGSHEQT